MEQVLYPKQKNCEGIKAKQSDLNYCLRQSNFLI